tara:strand:- start:900 stop:1250 length:351 start_codon:yes stop_codon:yes gene_type:complete
MIQGPRNNVTHMPPPRCPVIIDDFFEGKRRCNLPPLEHSDSGICDTCDIVAKQEREKITTHAIDVRIYIKSHNGVVTYDDIKGELLHQIFVGAHEDIKLDWIEIEKNNVQLVAEGE